MPPDDVHGRATTARQHTDALRLLEPPQAPATEPEAVQAAKQGPVVDKAPRQQAVERFAERQLADATAYLVVSDRQRGVVVEVEVAKVRVSVEASQVSLARATPFSPVIPWQRDSPIPAHRDHPFDGS
jgi:hypothetical protein